ncbi:Pentatricopeptide repeat-containing family protein [Diplonema papillatum]|nr:Pentatricopeptide repeat-containing family protein [Diplonema papillatum]
MIRGVRFFPRGGKSNQCPPPLGWRDFETAQYFKEVGKVVRSTAAIVKELERLKQRSMGVTVGPFTYDVVLRLCKNKPQTLLILCGTMARERVPLGITHYNCLLETYGKLKSGKEIFATLREIRERGLRPDRFTYRTAMLSLAAISRSDLVPRILEAMQKDRVPADEMCLSAAVAASESVEAALIIFETYFLPLNIPIPRATFVGFLTACKRCLDVDSAETVVRHIGLCTLSGSCLIQIYASRGDTDKARVLWRHMCSWRRNKATLSATQQSSPVDEKTTSCNELEASVAAQEVSHLNTAQRLSRILASRLSTGGNTHHITRLDAVDRRLDPIFFHSCIILCKRWATEPSDLWVRQAEHLFDAFVARDFRHSAEWEPLVLELVDLYSKVLDASGLRHFKHKMQTEGWESWSLLIWKRFAEVEARKKVARIPETHASRRYSSGVTLEPAPAQLPEW